MSEIRRFADESEFRKMRATIVLTLNQWSHPLMKTGHTREFMANEIRAMAIVVDEFALLYDQSLTGPCFMERCYRLAHVLTTISTLVEVLDNISMRARVFALNMFNVFADQIGRLTLHGYDYSDEHAMIMAEKAKSETHFFDGRYSDADCEAIRNKLEELWNYLHWFKPDCACHNCNWEFELKNELDRRFEQNMITSERLIAESLRIEPFQPERFQPAPFQTEPLEADPSDDPFNFGPFRIASGETQSRNIEPFQTEASGSQSMNTKPLVTQNFNIEAFIESLKFEGTELHNIPYIKTEPIETGLDNTPYIKTEPMETKFHNSPDIKREPMEAELYNSPHIKCELIETETYNSPYIKTEPFQGESPRIKAEPVETDLYNTTFIKSEP